MKVNGTNYYIGRSQSGSYTTSDSISSTRLNTRTSGRYSTQYYTYNGGTNYVGIHVIRGNGTYAGDHYYQMHTSESFTSTAPIMNEEAYFQTFDGGTMWYYTHQSWQDRSYLVTLTATNNVYYTTIITNGVSNITVSTTKSASSSSHNFV